MSETEVMFDSDVIDDLAPFDSDGKGNSSSISGFAMPRSVLVEKTDDGLVERLRFVYPNGMRETEDLPLDAVAPSVVLIYAGDLFRIESITLSEPGRRDAIIAVAHRIREAAQTAGPRCCSFSHRMIADAIEYYASDIVGESPRRVPIEHIFAGHEVAGVFYEDDDYKYEDGEAFSVKLKNGCVVDVWKDEDDPEGGFRVMVDRSFDRRYHKWQDVLEKAKQLVEAFDE